MMPEPLDPRSAPAVGPCSRCKAPDSPLVVDPLAYALRGVEYRHLCRDCERDLALEA